MLALSLSWTSILLTILVTFLNHHCTYGDNVTFTPVPINITVDNLPVPFATPSASKGAKIIAVPSNPLLSIPNGFTIKQYMSGLVSPRYLLYTPSGDLLVSEPNANRISCLLDTNNDGYPDERITFADISNGLSRPYGMAFADGYFYVGCPDATRRYQWTSGSRRISGTGQVVMAYPAAGHWTRTVVASPNLDHIFVSIGSASNVNAENLPRASIQQANLNGDAREMFGYGLRNAMGLAFHPITKELYVTCQERDGLGDDLVPDYFTRVQQNDYYGWPYAYMSSKLTDPRRRLANGTSERPDLVALTRTPDVLFQAHSGAMDIVFYTGTQFPTKYQNGVFAAHHGSWNRMIGTGYKIVFIPFDKTSNRPLGYYEDFAFGFLTDPSGPNTFGRPVGLLVLKDGSLIFTEDGNNRIYQIQYNNPNDNVKFTDAADISSTSISNNVTIKSSNNSPHHIPVLMMIIFNILLLLFLY